MSVPTPPRVHEFSILIPGSLNRMWKWFTSVDVDGNGRITAVELQLALRNGNHTSFDISTIEMLMKLFVCVKRFPVSAGNPLSNAPELFSQ
jgi:hypothetical protein